MKFIVITKDPQLEAQAREGFHPSDECHFFADWVRALDGAAGADMMFVDLIATLLEPHKIAGYEHFAMAKMSHAVASKIPLVLIAPEDGYELDFMAGWQDFIFGHVRRPISYKTFRRASTWV